MKKPLFQAVEELGQLELIRYSFYVFLSVFSEAITRYPLTCYFNVFPLISAVFVALQHQPYGLM